MSIALLWASSCQRLRHSDDSIKLSKTIIEHKDIISITDLFIESDLGFYSPVMSTVPGLPLRPVLKGKKISNNILYHWSTEYGGFLNWKQDKTIEILGDEVFNSGEEIYWSSLKENTIDNTDFYIYLNIRDKSDNSILIETNILIKTDGKSFYLEDKEEEILRYDSGCLSENVKKPIAPPSEFSIKIKDHYLSLFDRDDEVDFDRLLGKPLNENIEILGEGADTFAGSYIKTMQYEGLELKLLSAADNGESFSITDMKVTSDIYSTTKNTKVNDTLEELIESYPSINKVLDGRTDDNNCTYESFIQEDLSLIHFEVNEGIIVQIHFFYLIP